ncbi:hypothetical protein HN014_00935 [Aquimarina sp. TRL1]|uniref:hypothetical protein n=1 Tax=Aquimarina sp. (strain TRL1) TaxID=2736252 RepID=UPI00158A4EE0|nr:hypothetical protein [Aquimarina sp. TRL1]QKX03537.1 hypothetical protein HN014_00935 [Aquimarina sp. TRL1]
MLHKSKQKWLVLMGIVFPCICIAQTTISGFFSKKEQLTVASSYTYKFYERYYSGTRLTERNPPGFDRISSTLVSLYGEYGLTDWLSFTATLPYISIGSEGGALDPYQQKDRIEGLQDLGFFAKARVANVYFTNGASLQAGVAAGTFLPVGDYEGRGLLSLGTKATTMDGIGVLQFTTPFRLFAEVQAGYSYRYHKEYTVPDAFLWSAKLGYYNRFFYTHAKIGVQQSVSGYDIGSPQYQEAGPDGLPETRVNYTNLSFDLYIPVYKQILGVSSGYSTTIDGRNMNKERYFSFGLVYKQG